MLELYGLGIAVHFLVGVSWFFNTGEDDDSRNAAKLMWLSVVWPLLWVFGILFGLYKFFRYAWIDD